MQIEIEIDDRTVERFKRILNKKMVWGIGIVLLVTLTSFATIAGISFTFTEGEQLDADKLMTNFEYIDDQLEALDEEMTKGGTVAGTVMAFAGDIPPEGFYECDGSEVSRTDNPELFAAIGTMYGEGNGMTTFNLPDYRGYFLRGWDHGAGRDPDAADRENGGDVVGSIQMDEIKSHGHKLITRAAEIKTGDDHRLGELQRNFGLGSIKKNFYSNGGRETRPVNVNVMFIVKSR